MHILVDCENWAVKIGIMQLDTVFQHLEHAKNNLPSIFLTRVSVMYASHPTITNTSGKSLSLPFGWLQPAGPVAGEGNR